MAKRPIPSVAEDFENVRTFLAERGLLSTNPVEVDNARKIHSATHSLILWRFRLGNIPEHGRAFIEEIASDALQILPQIFTGYIKTSKLMARGVLENTLRHIYYSDHPVEFIRMNGDSKWYMSMAELLEYARMHPDFAKTEKKFDALSRTKTLYDELSAGIHGRRVSDLEMRVALEKLKYEESSATKLVGLVERCAEASNFLLAIYQRERFSRFGVEDRRAILRTMPSKAKTAWREVEP